MNETAAADSASVIAPAPVFFGAAIVAGYLLEWLFPTRLLSFPYAAALGALSIVVSIALVLFAVVPLARAHTAFDARRPSTRIVTTGAFKISRNPVYLSLALLQVGLALASQAAWLLLTATAAVAITHWGIILREERYLERKFGDEYRAYAANVRRWI